MTEYLGVKGTDGKILRDVTDSNGLPVVVTGSNVTDAQTLWTPGMLFNETTSDKPRGNTQGTLLASAARTATVSSPNQTNYNSRGILFTLNVTAAPAAPGAGGLTVQIIGIDPVSGNGYFITAAPALITTVGTFPYELYPGDTTASGSVAQRTGGILPRTWNVRAGHGDAQSYTYSVSYSLNL